MKHALTYKIRYWGEHENVDGVTVYSTMFEAVQYIKQLSDRSGVMGVSIYSAGKYQETIGIGGLL